MNRSINQYICAGVSILALTAGLNSCTKNYAGMNTNPAAIASVTSAQYPQMFAYAQQTVTLSPDNYEIGEGAVADVYSQYFGQLAGFNTDRYGIQQTWLPSAWNPAYVSAAPQLLTILAGTDKSSAEHALANIWWVWTFHRLTDYWGPIPYSQAGSGTRYPRYDPQDSIYYDFLNRLDTAVTVLNNHKGEKPFGSFDLVYNAQSDPVSAWIKFANTLRLRLAMRISAIDPSLAKTEAEAAVAAGVMTDIGTDAYMEKTNATYNEENGLSVISGWEDIGMSATMASIQKGYNDPRMPIYWQPATATGDYNGLRNGITDADKGNIALNSSVNVSHTGTQWCTYSSGNWHAVYTMSQGLMHAAEAWFLRAEGALNGWNMGDNAQDLYETGIRTSMAQWGITDATAIDTYVSNTATPVAPGDGMNSAAVNNYPVLWSSDATMERAQVAQQKWLALFPDGMEAWAEYRRTDLPLLYEVMNSDNADLPVGTTIKRMPFLNAEELVNADQVAAAVLLLGGPDNAATRVWWDVK
jgi:Susd and RagB outer membrane lipoprotein